MPITVRQRWTGYTLRIGEQQSITSAYVIEGTSDEGEAWTALNNTTPTQLFGFAATLFKSNVDITDRLAENAWEGEVTWDQVEQSDDSATSFDTGGGTSHITNSLATRGRFAPAGQTAPDFRGAIGVTESGVEGVDIQIPALTFRETHVLPASAVTPGYIKTLAAQTGRTNGAPFRGFAVGEVLFTGAAGSKKSAAEWEIDFGFAASQNAPSLQVGNITVSNKQGHDLLWVRYQEEEDTTAKRIVRRPLAAYVEQVYPVGDFSLLLI